MGTPLDLFVQKMCRRSLLNCEEQAALLALSGSLIEVRTNRDFVRLGEVVTDACLVVEGLVGRFGQNRQGVRQITTVHIAGDMADLHSVVVPKASSALQALTSSTILKVPHEQLRDIAYRFPRIAEAFWRQCVIDGSLLAEWVVNVGRRNAVSAMAHLLCEMAYRYRDAGYGDGDGYHLGATQAHLADMLGLTPVHVNRTLKELRRLNLITITCQRVTIHDWNELVRIGEFDPSYLHLDPLGEVRRGEIRQTSDLAVDPHVRLPSIR